MAQSKELQVLLFKPEIFGERPTTHPPFPGASIPFSDPVVWYIRLKEIVRRGFSPFDPLQPSLLPRSFRKMWIFR